MSTKKTSHPCRVRGQLHNGEGESYAAYMIYILDHISIPHNLKKSSKFNQLF